jgi:hypothetical protein
VSAPSPPDVEATQRRLYQVFAARRNSLLLAEPPTGLLTVEEDEETALAPTPWASRPLFHVWLVVLALVFWFAALQTTDLGKIGDYGLLSALPLTFYAALGILTVGFLLGVRREVSSWLLAPYLVAFVAVVHASPVILYGTLRYAWAWKHVGVVDYFMRTHSLDPHLSFLPIYQNWPGFFGLTATLTEAAGLRSALSFAAWAPPVFELLNVAALWVLFGALTGDRRVRLTACWFFLIANWVGQDYFAPQAFVYFLCLAAFGIVLTSLARRPAPPRIVRRVIPSLRETVAGDPIPTTASTIGTVAILTVVFAVVATSHPLTPMVLTAALVGLALFGVLRVWALPLIMGGLTGLWLLTGARTYWFDNTSSIFQGFGSFSDNLSSNLVQLSHVEESQRIVAQMGRLQVAVIALLAIVGLGRRLKRGSWDAAAIVLLCSPVVILVGGNYDGEALFRVFLFALPFAAFFMALLLYPSPESGRGSWTTAAAIGMSALILVGFLFAYYGKEAWSYFTRSEVRAAEIVYDRAPNHTLLVEGTRDYPNQFHDAERFTYVTLATEPTRSVEQVLKHPVAKLDEWLSDPRYRDAYLLITRAQMEQIDAIGPLPRHSLQKLVAAIASSPRFEILYHDQDALLLRSAKRARAEAAEKAEQKAARPAGPAGPEVPAGPAQAASR